MKRFLYVLPASFFALWAADLHAAPLIYEYELLISMPEDAHAYVAPYDINDSGVVAGLYQEGNSSKAHGFIYDNNGIRKVGIGNDSSHIGGFNDSGQFVGSYVWLDDDRYLSGVSTHGFLYNGTDYVTIDHPEAGQVSNLRDINDRGQIIGGYVFDNPDAYEGYEEKTFLYENGTFTAIDYPGSESTGVNGINDHGVMVGSYLDGPRGDLNSKSKPFIYENGEFRTISDFPEEWEFYSIVDITNSGNFLGTYTDSDGHWHGYVYDGSDYESFDIEWPEWANGWTMPLGMNESGEIVGLTGTYFFEAGFIARPSSNNHTEVPEPATMLMFGVAASMIAVARKRML